MAGFSALEPMVAVAEALQAVGVAAWNDPTIKVCAGHPGLDQPDDIVMFGDLRVDEDPATLGPRRSRNAYVEVDVTFSSYRAGGPSQEKTTRDRVVFLLQKLAGACQADPTIGQVAIWCFLTRAELSGDTLSIAAGRTTELIATFRAFVRVTG